VEYVVSKKIAETYKLLKGIEAVQSGVDFIKADQQNTLEDQLDLVVIEAPTFEEGERAKAFADKLAALGLEGIVGKAKNSPYLPGKRSPHWKKARVTKEADFVICGYTTNPKGRTDLSALVIGLYAGEKLLSYGLVGAGLGQREIEHLLRLFAPLQQEKTPLANPPVLKNVRWLKPRLVCAVEFLAVTPDGHLRHPLYKGLRERPPEECRVEN